MPYLPVIQKIFNNNPVSSEDKIDNMNSEKKNNVLHPKLAADNQALLPTTNNSTANTTPIVSTNHSVVDLVRHEEQAKAAQRGRQLQRQLSECVPETLLLPLPATTRAKNCCKTFVLGFMRLPALLFLLYLFICSLDFLSTSFRLIAGKAAGNFKI